MCDLRQTDPLPEVPHPLDESDDVNLLFIYLHLTEIKRHPMYLLLYGRAQIPYETLAIQTFKFLLT